MSSKANDENTAPLPSLGVNQTMPETLLNADGACEGKTAKANAATTKNATRTNKKLRETRTIPNASPALLHRKNERTKEYSPAGK
jgi:hypothetical protein